MGAEHVGSLEALALAALCTVALAPLIIALGARRGLFLGKGPRVAISLGIFAYVGLMARLGIPQPDEELIQTTPAPSSNADYVSSVACASCHPAEYESWKATFHRTMTQVATPETVRAPWDSTVLGEGDERIELKREGDQFLVKVSPSLAGDRVSHDWNRVVMATGSHHMQSYWIPSTNGAYLALPWLYWIDGKRWMKSVSSFLGPDEPPKPIAWVSCSQCHSTNFAPGMNEPDKFAFEVTDLGIACEACHGPAAEHIRQNQSPLTRYSRRFLGAKDSTIVNPKRLSHERASAVCGQCHRSFKFKAPLEQWLLSGSTFRPGDDFDDHFKDTILPGWADGTKWTAGREHFGLTASACYQQGDLSCLSCHSMHAAAPNDLLAEGMEGNGACVSCHAPIAQNLEAHTHHPPESSGSLCYNCHMPHTTWALLGSIRSHKIDAPQVSTFAANDRPNACNLCHLDKPLGWTAQKLEAWYGTTAPQLRPEEREIASGVLWVLQGHAAQRAIVTTRMGWADAQRASGRAWMVPLLADGLDDPYPAIRTVSGRVLEAMPGYSDLRLGRADTPEGRRAEVDAVMARWRELPEDADTNRVGSELLLDGPRQINRTEYERLRASRDHREVRIIE